MDSPWLIGFLILFGYLLGSIPFGVVVSRALGAVDPRSAGSRNVGFTNVLRVSGKKAGVLTLIGDIGKGWAAGWAATLLLHQEAAVLGVALASIIGHLHSMFLGFKGGKGVATALGAALGVA
ncbi:MAG: glycerol-3-phosphate acyltransferase, partial [Nitrospira sp. CR2.1]|nr:glycerol-3-phosphate acyltransferase [Nitrospira sp. CR2.1]